MTFFEASGQSSVFLLLLYAGAAAAILYDLLSLPRRRCPRAVAAVLDALWCLLCALLCLLALALGGENHLRLYALLGMVSGAGIYCLGVRRIVLCILRGLKKALGHLHRTELGASAAPNPAPGGQPPGPIPRTEQ